MAVRSDISVEIDGHYEKSVLARVDDDGDVHIAWAGNVVVVPAREAGDFLRAILNLIDVRAKRERR